MTLPSPEEIKEAIKVIENIQNIGGDNIILPKEEMIMTRKNLIADTKKVVISVLSALKSGELVGKEELERQAEKHKTCHLKNAEYIDEIVSLRKQLQSKYMSVEEVYAFLRENVRIDQSIAFGGTGVSTKLSNDCYNYLAQALTRLPKEVGEK